MSIRQLRRRIEQVQKVIAPPSKDSCTFQELIQEIWRRDKNEFWKLARSSHMPLFLCIPGLRTRMQSANTVVRSVKIINAASALSFSYCCTRCCTAVCFIQLFVDH